VPVMNKIINEYLVRFGLPIEFTLDENFNETIKSRFRDHFSYNNFSEGEKQRIDTALLLAWRQIAKSKNTTNCNILIMDETFDSSLDAMATDELLNILLEMDKNTNIFIMSHKSDLGDKLRSTITFEKHGNFTRMVDSVR
jgi:ABC-type multidrug transport system ATPase subunit